MSATKTNIRWGVLGMIEASYGAGGTLVPATHGIRVHEDPAVTLAHTYDGRRAGKQPATQGAAINVAPSGRSGSLSAVQEVHGGGAAYSTTVLPSLHTLLRIAGMEAALVASTSYAYTPSSEATGFASGAFEVYRRSQMYALKGVYGDGFTLSGEAGRPSILTVPLMGQMPTLPTDVALPAITYPSVLPPKALAMAAAINAVSALRCRSYSLEMTRNLAPRVFDTSTGVHGGFTPGAEREFRLQMTIEAVALATLNPFSLRDLQTVIPVTFGVGATALNKFVVSAANAQIEDVVEGNEGPVATWDLTLALKTSTPSLNDEVSILFN
jgi:hypothetical protein